MAARPHDEEKAKRILTAVRKILAQKGYMGTTVNQVAQEAGVSRGLLHYYFKNKDEMLARAIKENMDLSIRMIRRVFAQYHDPQGISKGIVDLLRNVMETDPDFLGLFFEGFAVARNSPVVQAELAGLYGQFRKALEQGLGKAKADGIISPALPVNALAAIITGLIDGIGLQLLTEPDLNGNQVIWDSIETGIADLLVDTR
ncbi:MAG: TetR/AcrR family transcriptional regulator [Desulfobacterales bacterium]|nr:TetR/AcrR family transcriptional regulator [Desulfobacterales bacterium]